MCVCVCMGRPYMAHAIYLSVNIPYCEVPAYARVPGLPYCASLRPPQASPQGQALATAGAPCPSGAAVARLRRRRREERHASPVVVRYWSEEGRFNF